jgi:hypothetical protein
MLFCLPQNDIMELPTYCFFEKSVHLGKTVKFQHDKISDLYF